MFEIDRSYFEEGKFKTVRRAQYKDDRAVVAAIVKHRSEKSTQHSLHNEVPMYSELGKHPNVLEFYGMTIDENGELCMVMEFAQRGSLRGLLLKISLEGYKVDDLVLVSAAKQVSQAMAFIARRGLVHRNLSARNVFVFQFDLQDPSQVLVKVADLSNMAVESDMEDASDDFGSNQEWNVWMAPEMISKRLFSEKSDVWAFGVTMWEMWSYGELPYSGTSADIPSMIINGNILPQPSQCPGIIYVIMQDCWQSSTSKRPSFQKLEEKLKQV
ncbi:hypothetical protein GUITHDRAFT_81295, partial [Guillardia theta CCMP2712]